MTVLERLRELHNRWMRSWSSDDPDYIHKHRRDEYAGHNLPTLLALAEAVKAKDQQAMDKALAELEKEAP